MFLFVALRQLKKTMAVVFEGFSIRLVISYLGSLLVYFVLFSDCFLRMFSYL